MLYQLARHATDRGRGRFAVKLARAREKVARWKNKPVALTLLAASVGIPPFYLMTLVAGILRMRFGMFLALAILGRIVRFSLLALLVLRVV